MNKRIILNTLLLLLTFTSFGQNYYTDVPEEAKETIFIENFEGNSNNWFEGDDGQKEAVIKNGKYFYASLNPNVTNEEMKSGFKFNQYASYEIEYYLKFEQGPSNQLIGFKGYFPQNKTYDYVIAGINAKGEFTYITKSKNKSKEMDVKRFSKVDGVSLNKYNKLTIRIYEAKAYVFLNEKFVFKNDIRLVFSEIGIVTRGTGMSIDKIVVSSIAFDKVIRKKNRLTPTYFTTKKMKDLEYIDISNIDIDEATAQNFSSVKESAKNYLLIDNFDNNDHNWPLNSNDNEEELITKGHYVIHSYNANERLLIGKSGARLNAQKYFEIETRLKLIGGDTLKPYGLTWFIKKSYYSSTSYDLYKDQQKKSKKLEKMMKYGDYNTYTIRVIDDVTYFFINGQFLRKKKLSTSYGARPDLLGFITSGNSIAVDYLTVAQIDPFKIVSVKESSFAAKQEEKPVTHSQQIQSISRKDSQKVAEEKKKERALVQKNTSGSSMDKVGNFYALIIGVQNYTHPSVADLKFPIRDAQRLYDVLVEKYNFKSENINFLQDPSRSEIIKAFNTLRQNVKENDNVLIFYAGHGYYDESINEGYWLPSDAEEGDDSNWISNANLSTKIKGVTAKHTLLISDACFGGSIFRSTRSAFNDASGAINNYYEKVSKKGMTSGTLKTVPDESVFAKYLIKRLKENQNKYLSASALFYSFNEAVANNSDNAPQYGTLYNVGDEGGQFIFIQSPTN